MSKDVISQVFLTKIGLELPAREIPLEKIQILSTATKVAVDASNFNEVVRFKFDTPVLLKANQQYTILFDSL